jgi:hypothetical protein
MGDETGDGAPMGGGETVKLGVSAEPHVLDLNILDEIHSGRRLRRQNHLNFWCIISSSPDTPCSKLRVNLTESRQFEHVAPGFRFTTKLYPYYTLYSLCIGAA